MTREQAKKIQPIVQAYADGKTIQYRLYDGSWRDIKDGEGVGGTELAEHPDRYRIKPEPREFQAVLFKPPGCVGSLYLPDDKTIRAYWQNTEIIKVREVL